MKKLRDKLRICRVVLGEDLAVREEAMACQMNVPLTM